MESEHKSLKAIQNITRTNYAHQIMSLVGFTDSLLTFTPPSLPSLSCFSICEYHLYLFWVLNFIYRKHLYFWKTEPFNVNVRNLDCKHGSQAIGATHGTNQGVSGLKWESLWKYRALYATGFLKFLIFTQFAMNNQEIRLGM